MSALGGLMTFGAPADRRQLEELGAHLTRLGPDGGRELTLGTIGMTYRAFHTNAESRREHQPFCSEGTAILCWDGRLDNREELVAQLRDECRRDDADIEIVMAAWRRWGQEAIAKLIADFALAIWDRRHRAVWLARDCAGTRSLYYHIDRDRAMWSTDLGALLDVAQLPVEVNDEYVAGLLTRGPEPGETPYLGVHAVKPAHVVRIGDDGVVSQQPFWKLDLRGEIRYRTDAEYEEHFRSLFRRAVRVRLRADRPVFAELSGGLDSSSIVCMADDVLRAHDAPAPRLETISYVFDDASTSDERKWIAIIEQHRKRKGLHITDREAPFFSPLPASLRIASPAWTLMSSAFDSAVALSMREVGAGVRLSGHGGDHVLRSTQRPCFDLADLLYCGRLRRLHVRLTQWSLLTRQSYADLFLQDALAPLLSDRTRAHVANSPGSAVPPWFESHFVNRFKLRERVVHLMSSRGIRPSVRATADAFYRAVQETEGRGWHDVPSGDIAFPWLDRPLVEFLQAVPYEQKLRPGETRSLMRRALAGLVPAQTIARRGKGTPQEVVLCGLARNQALLHDILRDSRVCAKGYVDRSAFQSALMRAAAGREVHTAALLATIRLEIWLRRIERPSEALSSDIAVGAARAASITTQARADDHARIIVRARTEWPSAPAAPEGWAHARREGNNP